ncbi:MAG TPA: S41 family peptidase [Flavitalea sp.]|nr:S41 family peptidase [Flavitalea sp.]
MRRLFLLELVLIYNGISIPYIVTSQVSEHRTITNVMAFAKLYGYIKYFHPSDEASKIDWEEFASYGVMRVKEAKSDAQLISILRELYSPMAPTLVLYKKGLRLPTSISPTPSDTSHFDLIYWQHIGVQLDMPPNTYRSVRVNRPFRPRFQRKFGSFLQRIDAKSVAGDTIRLKASMKLLRAASPGFGQLWLEVINSDSTGYSQLLEDQPAIDTVWKRYGLVAYLSPSTVRLSIGALLSGSGTLLLDDFELSAGRGDSLREINIQNHSFEVDLENQPAGWLFPPNQKPYTFTLIPSDSEEGRQSLSISKSDSIKSIDDGHANSPIFTGGFHKIQTVTKHLTEEVLAYIPISLYGNSTATYPSSDSAAFRELEKRLVRPTTQETLTGSSVAMRLANVVIAWNVLKHFFPYWDYASETPQEILEKAISRALIDKSNTDFLKTLRLMTAPLNDGHIYVGMFDRSKKRATLPLKGDWIDKKLIVTEILDSTLQGVKPGDIVSSVDGVEAKDYLHDMESLISGSKQWKRSVALSNIFDGELNSIAALSIERESKINHLKLARNFTVAMMMIKNADVRKSGPLGRDLFYVNLTQSSYEDILQMWDQLEQSKGIIFDLRGYAKDNHQLLNHLLDTSENRNWMFTPKIMRPDFEQVSYDSLGWNLKPHAKKLKAKIIFITNAKAISYSESILSYVKYYKMGTIIGEPTAGANGDVNRVILPGGYNLSFTGMLVKGHDGSQLFAKGIMPDVLMHKSRKAIIEGRDEFLDEAVKIALKP